MLTVGIVGGPWIGAQTAKTKEVEIEKAQPGIYETISKKDQYILGSYDDLDGEKLEALGEEKVAEIEAVAKPAEQKALARIAVLPIFMLAAYLLLTFYFRSKGGYKAVAAADH
jgi:hypothetical protein